MTREDCLLLGTIAKTRGVRGELVLRIRNTAFEPDENWESLFLQIDGVLVPFFIAAIHPVNDDEWFVSFDDYESKDRVVPFVGRDVWIRKDLIGEEEKGFILEELKGYHLLNVRTGKMGRITGIIHIPDNPLFEVTLEGETVMVPARDELVEQIDRKNRRLSINLPEGMM